MNFKDFIDNTFNDQDIADLKELIDFLENKDNFNALFQYWNTLDFKIPISEADQFYIGIIQKLQVLNVPCNNQVPFDSKDESSQTVFCGIEK